MHAVVGNNTARFPVLFIQFSPTVTPCKTNNTSCKDSTDTYLIRNLYLEHTKDSYNLIKIKSTKKGKGSILKRERKGNSLTMASQHTLQILKNMRKALGES